MRPIVYHIPICPFCQRLEILLALKGASDQIRFEVVDITQPRPAHLLELTGGTTALPVLELEGKRALRESLVLMDYLEERFPDPPVRRSDPYERALERLLVALGDPFIGAGYRLVMNQDPARRDALVEAYLAEHRKLDAFLRRHGSQDGPWLFDRFGWAEAAYTPFFQRFAFVRYYEGVDIPDDPAYDRVRAWRDAAVAHAAAQQTSDEEVIKLYYDYSRDVGNGGLLPGRKRSSFAFEPHWKDRPWPPAQKYGPAATDEELGLL